MSCSKVLEGASAGVIEMHHALSSLIEELQAIDLYNQRIDVCKDKDLRVVLDHSRTEEKEHVSETLEWIRKNDKELDVKLRKHLFPDVTIVTK